MCSWQRAFSSWCSSFTGACIRAAAARSQPLWSVPHGQLAQEATAPCAASHWYRCSSWLRISLRSALIFWGLTSQLQCAGFACTTAAHTFLVRIPILHRHGRCTLSFGFLSGRPPWLYHFSPCSAFTFTCAGLCCGLPWQVGPLHSLTQPLP